MNKMSTLYWPPNTSDSTEAAVDRPDTEAVSLGAVVRNDDNIAHKWNAASARYDEFEPKWLRKYGKWSPCNGTTTYECPVYLGPV
jgi:hypothetical protein